MLAFLAVAMFSLVAAATGINSLAQVGRSLDQITERRVPEALAWQNLSRDIEKVVRAAPALLAADIEEERQVVSADVFAQMENLSALLEEAQRYSDLDDEPYLLDGAIDVGSAGERAAQLVERINDNFVSLDQFVADRIELLARKAKVESRLVRGNSNAQRTLSPTARILGSQLADWKNGTASQPDTQLTPDQSELARSIILSWPEQQAGVLFDAFNRQIFLISEASTIEQVELLTFPLGRISKELETLISDMRDRTRRRLEKQLEVMVSLTQGPEGLPEIRKAELNAIAKAEELLGLNARLSSFLTNRAATLVSAANQRIETANLEALETRTLNRNILFGVVLLSIVSSLLIVWLYVSRSLTARLSALSNSMLAIADGDLHRPLPPISGNDEITRMAEALVGFRDTAVEVEESNLREVATARQRLVDAIESINEGFAFYDADDRLVLSNQRYKDLLYDQADVDLTPGTTFEAIVRNAAMTGLIEEARDDINGWIEKRLERHRNPGQPLLQKRAGNRWIMVSERTVAGGGTVALYTDLTTIKEYERELEVSQQRFRELFENAPVALFEEDWSGIEREIQRLQNEGFEDLEQYFQEHPDFVDGFANLVVWKDFNPAAVILYGAKDIESLRAHLSETQDDYSWGVYADVALAFSRGETKVSREVTEYTVDGDEITIIFTCQLGENSRDWSSITTTSQDITKLKQREDQLSHANQQIMSSVHYASRIQEAMLPSRKALSAILPDHFLIWEPRDIVGGDFFWCHDTPHGSYIIVGDCTGHGVPGAFMTLIACGLIDRHLRTNEQISPSALLSAMHADLQLLLGQNEENTGTDDGLEAGVCFIDASNQRMTYAGSRFNLFAMVDEDVVEIKGDKIGLGYNRYSADSVFGETEVSLAPGHRYILATDGLFDQIGGPKRRGFGKTRLNEFIKAHRATKVTEQGDALRAAFSAYQGDEYRRDDLTVLGFEISSR